MNFLLNKLRYITKRTKIIICVILIISSCIVSYLTYYEYKNTIVEQHQNNMLTTARAISRNIEFLAIDISKSMKILTLDENFIKEFSYDTYDSGTYIKDRGKAYYDGEKGIVDGVYFFNDLGNTICTYPENLTFDKKDIEDDMEKVIKKRTTHIGKAYLDKNKNTFILNIYEPILYEDNVEGVMVVSITIDDIYSSIVAPVEAGAKGYVMVKDQEGTILMHPVKEQIGMDVIETRKAEHPDLEFYELEKLIDDQLKGIEGTAVYHSYWWGDEKLQKVKKFNAYTPANLGDYFWVIAITTSYDEIQGPVETFLLRMLTIAVIMIIVIYLFSSNLMKMKKDKEALEKETEYLRTINETSEELRKKETELYHTHKLKIIGTLAGGIAHDINNLLTPILGYSELLLMDMNKDSEYYEDIEEIYKASQNGKELVEQILLLSRNDNNLIKTELIDVNKILKETKKLISIAIPKNIKFKENIDENCGFINANFAQIHQIFFNLCINAYQAIEREDGFIEIGCRRIGGIEANKETPRLNSEKTYVKIYIKDNGCGMKDEVKFRIFDPFYTTKNTGNGTGLGLFVVQGIIDKYKGSITVESAIGEGSTFYVYLPLETDEINEIIEIQEEQKNNKKKSIFLIDDNEEIIRVLKKELEYFGHKVTTENDAIRGLEYFKEKYSEFDIVITDYRMPNIKGSQLAAEIKKIRTDISIILITGYIDDNSEDILNNSCIDEHISKPIKLVELLNAINRL